MLEELAALGFGSHLAPDEVHSLARVLAMSEQGAFPITPPVKPMLAKAAPGIPQHGDFLFEPKWDGFRALIFRSATDVYIQSRDSKPFNRYFPDLEKALLAGLPEPCVLDGEIVIMTSEGLDFDRLQLRLHPAASRVAMLAEETPAAFVAFDALFADGRSLVTAAQNKRRAALEALFIDVGPPLYLTPVTQSPEVAGQWFEQFEGAGLDGVIAKPIALPYQPGKRSMMKIKHVRTTDCVVAGFRWYKDTRDAVGSLLLGLFDEDERLHHVGVTSSFTMKRRHELVDELAPLREGALEDHPWHAWAEAQAHTDGRLPGGQSRWSRGKDLSWEPLRIDRVCEVKYDHMQRDRFRHAARFVCWRPDKSPLECRYSQLDEPPAYDLGEIFSSGSSGS